MINKKIKRLVLAAMFAALCCIMTIVVQIPVNHGYVNLGDCAVLLGAWVLGPLWGGAAAGVGSALADVFGWASYAPGTFIIKFTMAVAAACIFRAVKKNWGMLLGAVVAELIMVGGYFLYESWVIGIGVIAAASSIPSNLIQGVVGVAAGVSVTMLLDRAGVLKRLK